MPKQSYSLTEPLVPAILNQQLIKLGGCGSSICQATCLYSLDLLTLLLHITICLERAPRTRADGRSGLYEILDLPTGFLTCDVWKFRLIFLTAVGKPVYAETPRLCCRLFWDVISLPNSRGAFKSRSAVELFLGSNRTLML